MKRWMALLVAFGAVAAIGVTAASAAKQKHAKHAISGSITIVQAGGVDFGSEDVHYYANLMAKHGIKVNYSYIGDAASAERALISGQADLLINSPGDEILAVTNGDAPIQMIGANNDASDYVLLGLPGKTLNNLNGATLGIDTPGSAGEVAALVALTKKKVDTNQLHPVTIGNSGARTNAILAGRIDLAPVHYGSALTALATGKVIETLDIGGAIGPGYIQSSLWASNSFLKNKALAQAAVNDFILSQRWANANKYQYVQIAQKDQATNGLTPDQMLKVWDYYRGGHYFGVNGGICKKYINLTVQLGQESNSIPKSIPAQSKWVNSTFVNTFLKKHHQKAGTC
jgi:ABC-type nitrate/sulfonate/bicarbonate transport system substrate-binding protein